MPAGKIHDEDKGRDFRQVGIVDANGKAGSYNGTKCNPWAGSKWGKYYTCQGNLLAGEQVIGKYKTLVDDYYRSLAEKASRN